MDDILKNIIQLLQPLTPEQRKDMLSEVGEFYCIYCGYEQPDKYRCQCWNDE